MRIVCPACEAEYDVPDNMLAAGARKVRCARCSREWAPFAPPPPPPLTLLPISPEAPIEVEPAPRISPRTTLADRVPPIAPPRERRVMQVPGGPPSVGLVIAWLFTAAFVVAGIGALWLKRPAIVHAYPPTARLFRLFGLDF